MNRINYELTGGLPVTQQHLDFQQQSFLKPFVGVAALFGQSVIVSGVDIIGGNATDGWVVINSELLPFVGGALGTEVVIVETPSNELFEDGISKTVYYERHATFGGPGGTAFSSFVRLSTIKDLTTAALKTGMIIMWSGDPGSIPAGFLLCDGTNGTPDLRGRFIVGYNPTDADYDTIGKNGGSKTHTLTINELPAHDHSLPADGAGSGNRQSLLDSSNNDETLSTGNKTGLTGGNMPHENRPPYYTLAYIMKA